MPQAGILHTSTGEVRWVYDCNDNDALSMARYVHWLTLIVSDGLEWSQISNEPWPLTQHGTPSSAVETHSRIGNPPVPGTACLPAWPNLQFVCALHDPSMADERLPELVAFVSSPNLWVLAWPSPAERRSTLNPRGVALYRVGWRTVPSENHVNILPVASVAYDEIGFAECLISMCRMACGLVLCGPVHSVQAEPVQTSSMAPQSPVTFNEELSYGGAPFAEPVPWNDPSPSVPVQFNTLPVATSAAWNVSLRDSPQSTTQMHW